MGLFVLSVVPIKQSSISTNYYLKQDGGYYIEDEKNKDLYQWFGKGAEILALTGAINHETHSKIYAGQLPNGVLIGKQMPDGSIKGRPGYDLTFSINKDLSLIICASNDKNLSDYFLKAHISAAKTALTEIEEGIEARITVDGFTGFEKTKNMISSLCTHFSSRAGDPDVHTHALIANATKRSDDKWRALSTDMSRKNGFFEMIRDNATYFGALYQNEMALAAKNKGFQIEPIHKNGMFKISGFPDDLRDHFSKRRKQIEEIVATFNPSVQSDKKIYDQVAQHSKTGKESIDQQSFYEKSNRDVQIYLDQYHNGKTFDEMLRSCIEKDITHNPNKLCATEISKHAINNAVTALSKFHISFDKNKIARHAITHHLGEITHQDIQATLNQLITERDLIPLKNNEYTTQTLIDREKNLIQSVNDAAKNDLEEKTSPKKDNPFLNIFSKNRFCVITEPNRFQDKNKCLLELIGSIESQGKKVKVLTLDKGINQALNDKNKPSISLLDHLKNMAKSDIAINAYTFIKQYETDINNPINNILAQKNKEVFIVDDAKRLDFDSIQKLINLSEKRQANIVFLKNHHGRHSLFSGNPIELIEKCDITKIDAHHFYQESKKISQKNNLLGKITITEPEECEKPQTALAKQSLRQKTLAKLFVLQNSEMENSMAISYSKKSTKLLNTVIRDELKSSGKIGREQYVIKMLQPIYLDDAMKSSAKSYLENAILKTYLGHGVFRTQKILGHDAVQNKVILQSEFGRKSLVDPNKITQAISRNGAMLYQEKTMVLSEGDRVCLSFENKLSKNLKLKSEQSYKIATINEKYAIFQSTSSEKIKVKLNDLNNLSLNYHYAISAQGSLASLKNKQQVFCDFPAYTVNANVMSDIEKYADKIHVITDDATIAKSRIDKFIAKESAIDYKADLKSTADVHKNSAEHDKEPVITNHAREMHEL